MFFILGRMKQIQDRTCRFCAASALSQPSRKAESKPARCAMSAILRFAKSRPILFGAGYSLIKTTGCDLMVQKVRARAETSCPCHQDRHGLPASSAGAADWPRPSCSLGQLAVTAWVGQRPLVSRPGRVAAAWAAGPGQGGWGSAAGLAIHIACTRRLAAAATVPSRPVCLHHRLHHVHRRLHRLHRRHRRRHGRLHRASR